MTEFKPGWYEIDGYPDTREYFEDSAALNLWLEEDVRDQLEWHNWANIGMTGFGVSVGGESHATWSANQESE